jgi:hypothetical protein
MTARATARSLQEPKVRFWWQAAAVMGAAMLYFLGSDLLSWNQELNIVRNGTAVSAVITRIGEAEAQARGNVSSREFPVQLTFKFNDVQYNDFGMLEGPERRVTLKDVVPIKINPDKPTKWTDLSETPPLGPVFLSAGMIFPFVLACGVTSYFLRRRVLGIWRNGVASLYAVELTTQTALAPKSRVVLCRAVDARTTRLIRVTVPRSVFDARPGDLLWLIHPHNKPHAAIAAVAYE